EHFGDDLLSGEGGEGKRRDEFLGGAGHHDLHVELFLLQAANEFRRFVSSHSASDTEGNFHNVSIRAQEAPASTATCGAFRLSLRPQAIRAFRIRGGPAAILPR